MADPNAPKPDSAFCKRFYHSPSLRLDRDWCGHIEVIGGSVHIVIPFDARRIAEEVANYILGEGGIEHE